jgi:hypothetical protein
VSESAEYLPLKLHTIHLEMQLMEHTGLYLPHVAESLLKVLQSGPLQRKQARKAGVEGSIELGYKMSLLELKNTAVLNGLFEKTLFHLHWLAAMASRMAGGPEIIRHLAKLLQALELGFSGHRKVIKQTIRLFL